MSKLFQVQGGYQNYAWGKIGSHSSVAQFAAATDPKIQIDEAAPYAELWMGTHPKVPLRNLSNGKSLREIVKEDPSKYLGDKIVSKFGSSEELPFLFKVLSIEKVLSIQAHPDKALAQQLHKNDPKNYPDDNHKPEMAIAVTSFEGFCGFKPLPDIAKELKTISEFADIVGEKVAKEFIDGISDDDKNNKLLLQKVFSQVMNCPDDVIAAKAEKLVEKAEKSPEIFGAKLADLIIRLNKQFPNDIGLFCGCLMLNYVELNPGEAVFLKAKDPHAYISGDIIECMAASDNVVRAGFTPKFKDVKNLVSMLTYSYDPVEKQKMVPQSFSKSTGEGKSALYDPPIEEFAVLQTSLASGEKRSFAAFDGPSIIIVTNGAGSISGDQKLEAKTGNVFFVAPGQAVEMVGASGDFVSYRAFVE